MRRPFYRVTEDEDTGIDMTPMLDIVFILLIFFVVTASFVKETGIDVNRPQAKTAITKETANIKIAIDANDVIWIDRRQIDDRSVKPMLERMHIENPQGALIVQADRKSTNDKLVRVMDAARQAGINSISIAAVDQ
ncbi:ExbD/TolR family protein [Ketobacter alkanivorans]|uniref:Biopolymer transporter ExbD n=1 Tax=Ketobacter alkanivorans TaxID=1917421 RepID=A0A2K9LLJ6_9GAMM|nr:biopolymer transporter ExbD [Ketobacter alkanivorans]AUM13051.1 biopolymer transporter ExbD [Ketobacter alkanivorans]